MQIGFIGVGLMGGPLARNLIRAGKHVTVYDRSPEAVKKTLAVGSTGKAAASLADLSNKDIVFTSLPLPKHVLGVMRGSDGLTEKLKPGAPHIELSTIDPQTSVRLEAAARAKGYRFLQCALGKTPAHAEKAEEPLFVGDDKAVFDELAALWPIIGSPAHYNHVVILPLDDLSNAASEAVANNIKGTMALPHPYGRLQFGADLDLHFKTLIGTGSNPNVAAVVVIGIEPQWTNRVVEGIAKTGKPVAGFSIEQHGDLETIRAASWKAKEFVHFASEIQRTECDAKELWVSCKCGETTELTGGEHLVAARCRTPEIRAQFQAMFDRYAALVEAHKVDDLCDSQPTKGNIEGGLTTIEEKALGNIQKIGKKCIVDGVLDKAEFQPQNRAHDAGTHRRGRLGHPAPGDQPERRRRSPARHAHPHGQRAQHCGRDAGTPRIRADAPLRERLSGVPEEPAPLPTAHDSAYPGPAVRRRPPGYWQTPSGKSGGGLFIAATFGRSRDGKAPAALQEARNAYARFAGITDPVPRKYRRALPGLVAGPEAEGFRFVRSRSGTAPGCPVRARSRCREVRQGRAARKRIPEGLTNFLRGRGAF